MSSASPSPSSPVTGVPPPSSTVVSPPQPSSPPPNPPTLPGSIPPDATSGPPPQVNSPPPESPPSASSPPAPSQPPESPPPAPSPPPESPPPAPSPPPESSPPAPSLPPQSPPPVPSSPPQSPPIVVSPPSPITSSPPPPEPPLSPPSDPPPSLPPQSPPTDPPPSPLNPTPSTTSPPPPPPNNSQPSQSPPPRPPRRSPPPPPSATQPRTPPPSSPPQPTNSTPPTPSSPSPPLSPPSSTLPPSSTSPPPIRTSPPSFTPPPPFPVQPNTNNTSPSSSSSDGLGTGGTVAIALIASLVLVGIFGFAACCVWKRKKNDSLQNGGSVSNSIRPSPGTDSGSVIVQISPSKNRSGSTNNATSSPHDPGGLGNSRSCFSYEELIEATNGFSDQNLLGEGGFGFVYKGNLSDGREVAVKRLKIGGKQGEREFRSEVEIISRIHHRHLVSLVGYCFNEDRRLLVYDYVPNNTLYYHLQGQGRPVIDWATRVKIAIGAARGVAYLHEDCHPRIIHRDIKSSNILLDDKFEARVSDFGLAKLAMDANSHVTTRVMGTFGYMAPEYATSGKLTEKSDVYSYGVVLLELITGRKSVDTSQPLGEESLVEWARPLLSHALETEEFTELADPKLEGNYVDSEMFRMIEAAAACVRHSAAKRPKMGQILRAFDSILDLNNGMKVGESEIFNSAQQSEEIRLFQRMAFGSQNYSTDFFTQYSTSSEGNRANSL